MGNYVSSSAIVLVLFILLVIILGAWIQCKEVFIMACNHENTCNTQVPTSGGSGYIIIIVLYILLAIILGAWRSC